MTRVEYLYNSQNTLTKIDDAEPFERYKQYIDYPLFYICCVDSKGKYFDLTEINIGEYLYKTQPQFKKFIIDNNISLKEINPLLLDHCYPAPKENFMPYFNTDPKYWIDLIKFYPFSIICKN
jgi:hypothetical protein